MRKLNTFILFLFCYYGFAQQPYYDDVDLTLAGSSLKNALATKITNTHTANLSYSDAREALKIVDLNPGQNANVLLLYGFVDYTCDTQSSNDNDHRLRSKSSFGGGATCEWNREHTYPKSLGSPNLGTSGAGADAHHLRSTDVQRNGNRGSKRFTSGSGNSGNVGSFWYPGDEWKGDVARMMMYMYLRYGSQCYPKNVCVGTTVANDSNMVNLLLQWNAEDPVSTYEDNRNTYLGNDTNTYGQGNRNPFIDNPHLATIIWGGAVAEDRWGIYLETKDYSTKQISLYPNPTKDIIQIQSEVEISSIEVYNTLGQLVLFNKNSNTLDLTFLKSTVYFLKIKDTYNNIYAEKIVKK